MSKDLDKETVTAKPSSTTTTNISSYAESTTEKPDGVCRIIGYIKIGGSWLPRYDPNDPDCPKR